MLRDGLVQPPDIRLGNGDEFGEASVPIDSNYFQILANVRLAYAALPAMAAIQVHFRADVFADLDAGDFIADALDYS